MEPKLGNVLRLHPKPETPHPVYPGPEQHNHIHHTHLRMLLGGPFDLVSRVSKVGYGDGF